MPEFAANLASRIRRSGRVWSFLITAAIAIVVLLLFEGRMRASQTSAQHGNLLGQSQADVDRKNTGCVSCHVSTDQPSMHPTRTVRLACTDCHGGDITVVAQVGANPKSAEYEQLKKRAHPQPNDPALANTSANPPRLYTKWLRESYEYVKFVNPGDLRVAAETCGANGCHAPEVLKVKTSMMTHGGMLWGAALYNNGSFPLKNTHFGESYSSEGVPQSMHTVHPPTPEETRLKGIVPELTPLERWEISQPGNVLRVFERGGMKKGEIGNPDREEESGRPDDKLGERGFGTLLRTDPVFLGLQKTRLLDPLLAFPGTNDQPGDYRASGCTACHVIYANDRSPEHSGHYAAGGNLGQAATVDPTIPKNESGHPLKHQFTRSIPSSQCIVCHIHPGTNMVAPYFGYTWWDNEVDGDKMYPKEQRHLSAKDQQQIQKRDPERTTIRGNWADVNFLEKTGTPEFNKDLKNTQFADFHSHGWIFRAAFKHDRKGILQDKDGNPVSFDDPDKFKKAVHLKDIHLEMGMHCIDCHFEQDSHGNGNLYGETRNAIEVDGVDCHGTIRQRANLHTSGIAAPTGGTLLARLRTPWGLRRFYW